MYSQRLLRAGAPDCPVCTGQCPVRQTRQVVGECIVEFTGVDVCRIEVAELYVEESIQ